MNQFDSDSPLLMLAWLVAVAALTAPTLLLVRRAQVAGESSRIPERVGRWNKLIVIAALVGTFVPFGLVVAFPMMVIGRVQSRYSLERGQALANFLIRAMYVLAGFAAVYSLLSLR